MAIEKTILQTSATNADFPFPFPYLQTSHVTVGVTPSGGTESIKVENTHYKINGQQVEFETSPTDYRPAANSSVRIYRSTPTAVLESTFSTGSPLTANDLNNNFKQLLYALEEAKEAKVVTATNAFTHGTKVDIDVQNDSSWVLTSDSVNTAEILNDAVTADKLKDHASTDSERAVTRNHIRNDAIDGTKIDDDAVNSEHIAADSIDAEHYAPGSVDATALGTSAVIQGKIADQAVNEAKLQISNWPTNGYVLTAQSGNTGGLTWATPNPKGSILETFTLPCNGKSITVQSGTYTTENVTSAQNANTTLSKIKGSLIEYKPPAGTQLVVYKFTYKVRSLDDYYQYQTQMMIGDTPTAVTAYGITNHYSFQEEAMDTVECPIFIDSSIANDDIANGVLKTWDTTKKLQVFTREYSNTMEPSFHDIWYYNGSSNDGTIIKPILSITAIA